MLDPVCPPRRIRFSFESRAAGSSLGESLQAAVAACGASPTTGYRLWCRFQPERWYDKQRLHGSLGGSPSISRVSHLRGHYT